MKALIKKIFFLLPKAVRRFLLRVYENFYAYKTALKMGIKIKTSPTIYQHAKKRILFYQISGMGHGGTDKHTQNLAKYLDKEKFDVYYMYSEHSVGEVGGTGSAANERLKNLKDSKINFIEFDYIDVDKKYPHVIHGMKPNFFEVLKENEIDTLIITSEGKTYFPFNLVHDIPIVMLNVFGSYTVQKNIVLNLCYTPGMVKRICTVADEKIAKWLYIPCEGPLPDSFSDGQKLRDKLGIKDQDVVFGRIGRDVDTIFNEIGIRAFQRVIKEYPEAHYLIMSPPPILRKIVQEDNIPNVHFLPPSSVEKEIWAFHMACDAYAHFRNDGETFGVNIAEAMMCDKPVITHISFVWNEHLDYLEESFSRIAGLDDVDTYAVYMREFINKKKTGELLKMGKMAGEKARKVFLPKDIVKRFGEMIDSLRL